MLLYYIGYFTLLVLYYIDILLYFLSLSLSRAVSLTNTLSYSPVFIAEVILQWLCPQFIGQTLAMCASAGYGLTIDGRFCASHSVPTFFMSRLSAESSGRYD